MKAVIVTQKGSQSVLQLQEIEKPSPNNDEVLVRIVAVSINAADYRSMKMRLIPKKKIFGADIAGIVESVGKNVHRFKPGDEVVGDLSGSGFGGFAEYVAAPEKMLSFKPESLSFEEAAAIPLAAVTALQGLRDKGDIGKEPTLNLNPSDRKRVLIVGSSGGVGTYAVQLARYFGAEVTSVCSTGNVEQTILLGSDYVIDYKRDDFTKTNLHFDIIIAVNGSNPLSAYKRLLNPNGRYVMIGGSISQIFSSLMFGKVMSLGSKKMLALAAKPNPDDLQFVLDLAAVGVIKPVISKCYPLEKTPEAMKSASEGHVPGKIVISI